MIRAITGSLFLVVAAPAIHAEMITQTSPHSVDVTLDRLETAVEGAGATIFARIDHAAGAAEIGKDLRPTATLIFGNPQIGTPAMMDNQTAGLDLPLRVLAYVDDDGVVHVTYHDPSTLADSHALPTDAGYLMQMSAALEKLTTQAIAKN